MTKEEAKAKLRKAESDLRQANIVLEMHEQGIQKIKDEIVVLQAIINKPDRWQDSLVQPEKEDYFYLISNEYEGLIVCFDAEIETDRRPEYAFKTKDQAELIKEKMLLMQEMYAFAHVRNDGWMPNWQDGEQMKYGIVQIKDEIEVDWFTRTNAFVFGVAVKSKAIAEEMLLEFGKRIESIYNKMY